MQESLNELFDVVSHGYFQIESKRAVKPDSAELPSDTAEWLRSLQDSRYYMMLPPPDGLWCALANNQRQDAASIVKENVYKNLMNQHGKLFDALRGDAAEATCSVALLMATAKASLTAIGRPWRIDGTVSINADAFGQVCKGAVTLDRAGEQSPGLTDFMLVACSFFCEKTVWVYDVGANTVSRISGGHCEFKLGPTIDDARLNMGDDPLVVLRARSTQIKEANLVDVIRIFTSEDGITDRRRTNIGARVASVD